MKNLVGNSIGSLVITAILVAVGLKGGVVVEIAVLGGTLAGMVADSSQRR